MKRHPGNLIDHNPDNSRPGEYLLAALALTASLYHLYTTLWVIPQALQHRVTHISIMLLIVFVSHGFRGKRKSLRLDLWTLLYAVLIVGFFLYMVLNLHVFLTRFQYVEALTTQQVVAGVVILLLILEGTRRSIGPQLPIVALVFMAYALFGNLLPQSVLLWHKGISFPRMLEVLYMGLDGMWGEPVSATSTYVFLFTLFASFLIDTGVGEFFSDFAISATQKSKGGAAKTAVIASALMGTISGASTANVVATGSFSIPLMKKSGFSADYAGAVEAVASTGGQIMPPVMGVAAFIMVEITGIQYKEIMLRAAFPAACYFLAIFLMVHFHASRRNIMGVGLVEGSQGARELLKRKWHLFLPLVVIMVFMIMGFTPQRASLFGIVTTIACAFVLKETRPTFKTILHALTEGAKMVAPIALACACAGIIMGMVMITGLGFKMMQLVVAASGGRIFIALLFSMVAAIILGMGVPTSAAYIIMATMLAPAIVNMGVPVIVAHLFVFYFACVSSITPPVALAAYAAAGISGGSPTRTGFMAMRLGIVSFFVPFMFVYIPGILLMGSPFAIARAVVSSVAGIYFLAAFIEGHMYADLPLPWRMGCAAAAILLLTDSLLLITLGVALGAMVILVNRRTRSKTLSGA